MTPYGNLMRMKMFQVFYKIDPLPHKFLMIQESKMQSQVEEWISLNKRKLFNQIKKSYCSTSRKLENFVFSL